MPNIFILILDNLTTKLMIVLQCGNKDHYKMRIPAGGDGETILSCWGVKDGDSSYMPMVGLPIALLPAPIALVMSPTLLWSCKFLVKKKGLQMARFILSMFTKRGSIMKWYNKGKIGAKKIGEMVIDYLGISNVPLRLIIMWKNLGVVWCFVVKTFVRKVFNCNHFPCKIRIKREDYRYNK